jgi:hypothetical protein
LDHQSIYEDKASQDDQPKKTKVKAVIPPHERVKHLKLVTPLKRKRIMDELKIRGEFIRAAKGLYHGE